GIGLALTRELVHFLNGEIAVESEPGRGTVFSITLPITRNAPAGHDYERSDIKEAVSTYMAPQETAGQPDEKTPGHQQYTVLIVEDNRDVVEYLRIILSPRFHLLAAYDGKQGLAQAREAIPDIIISDIMMPAMDGLEMCQQLKADKLTSHIPIILLTARADIDSRIEGLRTGADAYLAKPFNEKELLVRINKLIELRAQLQERYRDIRFLFRPRHAIPEEDFHPEDQFMRELHAIIEANLSAPEFSIGQLCEQIGMSRATLYRKFRAIANQPLSDFIRRVRLHKARLRPVRTARSIVTPVGNIPPPDGSATGTVICTIRIPGSLRNFLRTAPLSSLTDSSLPAARAGSKMPMVVVMPVPSAIRMTCLACIPANRAIR
ncbi:MAG: response regulator, partial [Phaeodactylibacter sp.]|nr:response regulator [Phaeodactylibacter sp.]